MLKWIGLAVFLLIIPLGATAYRYLQVSPYPIGEGRYEASPNGQYTAHASNLYDESFWGNTRSYYEFEIENNRGIVIRSIEIPLPPNSVDFRNGNGQIFWAADSKSVTFGTVKATIWSTTVP